MKQLVLDRDDWYCYFLRQPNEDYEEKTTDIPEDLWERYSTSVRVFGDIQEELSKYAVKR